MTRHLTTFAEGDLTLWERQYRAARPYHSYAIRAGWDEQARDFMAYWHLRQQSLLEEMGHPSAKPCIELARWFTPLARGDAHPDTAPEWARAEHIERTAELWESLSQDERDAIRGITTEQKADRDAWEALSPAEKGRLGKGSYRGTQRHRDGRLIDADTGETIGYWLDDEHQVRQDAITRGEDPDAATEAMRARLAEEPLVDKVRRWAGEKHPGAAHVRRWNPVLAALGYDTGERAMTLAEAEANLARFLPRRWRPVVDAMRQMAEAPGRAVERVGAHGSPEQAIADAEAEMRGETREGAETSQIDPEHVDRFCEWLMRERDLVAKECGAGHPTVKHRIHDHYIEDVRSGERVHSQIMFCYDQFTGWLRGEYGQRTARETTLWADGTEDDHSEAAYKAEQDAYAEEVKRFQAAREAGAEDAQQGFDEWRRPNRELFPFNGTYVEDTRTGCFIAYDQVARRREELTAENVRYRLDTERPDGVRQISWLALNYEGCLCELPHSQEARTRMVPAEEVPDLIRAGHRILTAKEYAHNQRTLHARDDKFTAFRLWAQLHPVDGRYLGICPTQGDSSDGQWQHNAELFARLHGHAAELRVKVAAPEDIAAAIAAGDWTTVARLAEARAGQ